MGNEASRAGRKLAAKTAEGAARRTRKPLRADATPAEEEIARATPETIKAADDLHRKDAPLSDAAEEAGKGVQFEIAEYGQEQLQLFHKLQQNPALLDGPEGPKYSSQIAAMQEAQMMLPPPSSDDALTPAEPKYGLLPAEGASRRVPHGELFPVRPSESGPGDQLILNAVDPEEQLTMAQVFEIFARHKEDPEYWTAARIADEYFTREEWVQALLQYTMAPTFVKFEGDFYGVYDVVGGPGDTHEGRAAKRLQLRANRAREAAQLEQAHREQRQLAEREKQAAVRQIADEISQDKPTGGNAAPSWGQRPDEGFPGRR